MKKTEILRSLHRLIAERGLIETNEDDDPVTVSPIDEYGDYCGWDEVRNILMEFEDSGKTYILSITEE